MIFDTHLLHMMHDNCGKLQMAIFNVIINMLIQQLCRGKEVERVQQCLQMNSQQQCSLNSIKNILGTKHCLN